MRNKKNGEQKDNHHLADIAVEERAEGGESARLAFGPGHDLQSGLVERMAEVEDLLALRRDADRAHADIGCAALHRFEQFRHGVDHARLERKTRFRRGFLPKIDRITGKDTVLFEGERLRGFDHDAER